MSKPMMPLTGRGGYMATAQVTPLVRGNGQTTSGEVTETTEQNTQAQDTATIPTDRESANGANENK